MLFSGNLRGDYKLLHKLEEDLKTDGKLCAIFDQRMIRELKAGIRNVYRERARYDAEEVYKWKSYRGNWDSRYCRIEYEGIFTEEEIKEYVDEEWQHWYNPYGDGRDCTGVWFTSFIYVFPIPACNKTVVYHIQNMDV